MKKKRILKVLLITGILLLIIITAGAVYLYPMYRFFFQEETIKVDPSLTVYRGGGGNSGILITQKAVVVIDTKMGSAAEKLYQEAKSKSGSLPIIVINTHYHSDHIKGNYLYKNSTIYMGDYDRAFLDKEVSAENQPTELVKDSLFLYLGNDTVCLYDMGRAHTFHDLVIYLKNHQVLFTGDLVFNHVNPVLKEQSGSSVDNWIRVLNLLITRFPNATFIPGHGSAGGKEIALSLLQYFSDLKLAAADPSKETEMTEKYKDWTEMPMMASPGKTIEFIKHSNEINK